MKQIMNKITILIILFSFLLINCQKKPILKNDKIDNIGLYNNQDFYKEAKFDIKKIKSVNNTEMYLLHHYKIALNSESEKATIIINNKTYPLNLNFTYDTDLENALSNIKIFEDRKSNVLIFIPTFGSNDEYTYQLLLVKNNLLYENTISYSVFNNSSMQKKIVINEENELFNIRIGKVNIKTKFIKQLTNLSNQGVVTKEEKSFPSNLKGSWAVNCQNELTELNINKNEGFLSLYDFNAIYINLKVEKSSKKDEYVLKFASTSSQRDYYKNMLMIVDEDISKDDIIGKLVIKKDGKGELYWSGLYNIKRKKLEFVGNDFLLIKENGGKTPLILEKCE